MSEPRHSEPYLQGFAAWHNGGGWDVCPYVIGALDTMRAAMDWYEGWMFAKRYAATLREAEDAGLELPVA